MKRKKHHPLLEYLAQTTKDQRKVLLKIITAEQLKVMLGAIYKVLFGRCPFQNKDKKKLKSQS